jgi:hypothetical protein
MPELPEDPVDALEAIRAAIVDKVTAIVDVGKVYGRERYAPAEDQYQDIMGEAPEVDPLMPTKVAFVYCIDFNSAPAPECTKLLITLTFSIEFIRAFDDGTDEVNNSTVKFDAVIMRAFPLFKVQDALGFTVGNTDVTNSTLRAGEGDGKAAPYDGYLAHRKAMLLDVNFRL